MKESIYSFHNGSELVVVNGCRVKCEQTEMKKYIYSFYNRKVFVRVNGIQSEKCEEHQGCVISSLFFTFFIEGIM